MSADATCGHEFLRHRGSYLWCLSCHEMLPGWERSALPAPQILPARIEQARDRLRDEAKGFAHVFGDDSRTCVQLRDIADELSEIARLQRKGG